MSLICFHIQTHGHLPDAKMGIKKTDVVKLRFKKYKIISQKNPDETIHSVVSPGPPTKMIRNS